MEYLYKKDKCLVLACMAAERQCSISYRDQSDKSRRNSAAKRKKQRAKETTSDSKALYRPPDKQSNFGKKKSNQASCSGHHVDLTDSDDDIIGCLLYTSPSPRDATLSRMPSSA